MATVTASVQTTTQSQQTPSSTVGTTTPQTITQNLNCSFQTSGTAADQVDLNYASTLSLAATPTTLDLKSLTDRYGGAVAFARVRSITITNNSTTNGQIITVAPGGSNGWTNWIGSGSTVIVGPSTSTNKGYIAACNPSTGGWVVDNTHKTLSLDPGANTFTCAIEINGASA